MKRIIYILLMFALMLPVGVKAQWPAIVGAISNVSAPSGPLTIPAFITNAYDASEASSITHASNVVSQWDDLIGSTDLTQSTAANKPLWNGTDAIFFSWSTASGSDDYMNGLEPGPFPLPVTFYFVLTSNSSGTGATIVRNNGAGQTMLFHNFGGSTIRGFQVTGGDVAYTNNTQVCVKVVFSPTASASSIQINNGTPVTFGGAITTISNIILGWSGSGTGVTFNGIYRTNKVPDSTEDAEIKDYISGKWGILF